MVSNFKDISFGDMPGDKIQIEEFHIKKAESIFLKLMELIKEKNDTKLIISVSGGSGVGKSETASLLSLMLNQNNCSSYILSGDNYVRRIPKYNDIERLQIFRKYAMHYLAKEEILNNGKVDFIRKKQEMNADVDLDLIQANPWYKYYIEGGKRGLQQYLGTENEIDFFEVNEILKDFKNGKEKIWLRRMGRKDSELWYEKIDFSNTNILIIEWTHGNSDYLKNIDIPILLNSTPEETLEHRKRRNRDGSTDSLFTSLVLGVEQELLKAQAKKAKLIVTNNAEIIDYSQFQALMEEL